MQMNLEKSRLVLSVKDASLVSFAGKWADGYKPQDATFQKDYLVEDLESLVAGLSAQESLLSVAIPKVSIAKTELFPMDLKIEVPLLMVDVVGAL